MLSIAGKIPECRVCVRLYDHITKAQHDFLRLRSCVIQLLSVLHNIRPSLDEKIQTDVIYLDFAKAFDSVNHQILLQKLSSYGVSGQFYEWFVDHLTGWGRQREVVEGATSNWARFTSSVPDHPYILPDETLVALYTDESKLCKSITSIGDCENLQQTLTDLDLWNRENNLDFNESKCEVLLVKEPTRVN